MFIGYIRRQVRHFTSAVPAETYTHGHHPAVLRQHSSRRFAEFCRFLLPHIKKGDHALDVGCGPGSITRDLAELVGEQGSTIGIDNKATAIEEARRTQQSNYDNLTFVEGNIYELPFQDNKFDIVLAHMVLQHVVDPILALKEMKRVLKPGGLLAVRDSEYSSMKSSPIYPGIELWKRVYMKTCYLNNAEPDAGLYLKGWVLKSGFEREKISVSFSTKVYDCGINEEERKNWGLDWAERIQTSDFGKQVREYQVASEEEIEFISGSFQEFASNTDAIFYYTSGEILARK